MGLGSAAGSVGQTEYALVGAEGIETMFYASPLLVL